MKMLLSMVPPKLPYAAYDRSLLPVTGHSGAGWASKRFPRALRSGFPQTISAHAPSPANICPVMDSLNPSLSAVFCINAFHIFYIISCPARNVKCFSRQKSLRKKM